MPQLLTLRTRPWLASLKGLFFPPVCLICNASMGLSAEEGACSRCGTALKPARATSPCDVSPEDIDGLFALYQYNGAARRLIHRIKLTGDPRAERWLGSELKRRDVLAGQSFDLILSVPSHRKTPSFGSAPRTSSDLWAQALGEGLGVPIAHALVRVRTVSKQTTLHRDQRLASPASSLSVRTGLLKGCRSALLADDVLTTGATARACARLLKRHGVERVTAAVIARG
jgi:competence protein ComFC